MGSGLGYTLGGLAGLGALLEHLDDKRRAQSLQEMKLREGQGTFSPIAPGEGPEQTFAQKLFGGGLPSDVYDLGVGRYYQFTPYAPLGEEGARNLFDIPGPQRVSTITTPLTTAADYQPFASSPAGAPPTPPSVTVPGQPVPAWMANLRTDPKNLLALAQIKAQGAERLRDQMKLEAFKNQLLQQRQSRLQAGADLIENGGTLATDTGTPGALPATTGVATPPAAVPVPQPSGTPSAALSPADEALFRDYNVDPRIARAILGNEGSGDTDVSPKGAVSRWQITPATARKYLPAPMQGLTDDEIRQTLTKYPRLASHAALSHLAELQRRYPARPDLVAAAYFSGTGNVDAKNGRIIDEDIQDLPGENGTTVREYVDDFMQRYTGAAGTGTSPSAVPSTREALPEVQGLEPDVKATFAYNQRQIADLTTKRDRALRAATWLAAQDGGQQMASNALQRANFFQSQIAQLQTQQQEILRTARQRSAVSSDTTARLQAEHQEQEKRVTEGISAAEAVLNGDVALPPGRTADQQALLELRKRGLSVKDYPELEARIARYKPLTPGERVSFVDPKTMEAPVVRTLAEADKAGLVQLPKEDATSIRQLNVVATKVQSATERFNTLLASDPLLARLRNTTGMDARVAEGLILTWLRTNQSNPLLKQLQADLADITLNYSQLISGLKGRQSADILNRISKDLPNLDASLFQIHDGQNWLTTALRTAFSAHLPDLPATVLFQLGSMQDLLRSTQEAILINAGALTPEDAAQKRAERMAALTQYLPASSGLPGAQGGTAPSWWGGLLAPFSDAVHGFTSTFSREELPPTPAAPGPQPSPLQPLTDAAQQFMGVFGRTALPGKR
jgi:Transglycosylase SLT domain